MAVRSIISKRQYTQDSGPPKNLYSAIEDHYTICGTCKKEQTKQITPYLLSKHAPNGANEYTSQMNDIFFRVDQ